MPYKYIQSKIITTLINKMMMLNEHYQKQISK